MARPFVACGGRMSSPLLVNLLAPEDLPLLQTAQHTTNLAKSQGATMIDSAIVSL